ncbi:hypothetical protein [Novosphingobium album (ex Hu et al. 2023)]|uniref:VCBS repeat-containing protein n=1 Tax=Novosphingobium album (ex Hu et al. 2023) TaxID=2930093 RepID=A0ABT0B043_9SPHN|nr:hypothetical protein [Novosphingobium album (ex Hu et al. 2023)]MCJ2178416.1 hypothetical protein [Novosphingobium album (ex Hu et al. 2023)]
MRIRLAFAASIVLLAPPVQAQSPLTPKDRTAAFLAAGFKFQRGQWSECGDPGTPSYSPGQIDTVRDLNGDGRPEAVITEGSTFCFGMTGTGFTLVSKQADGTWKSITSSQGIPSFLATKGVGGWPDIEIGGPGFCFPVERWNGKAYVRNRHQYEGKACRPQP